MENCDVCQACGGKADGCLTCQGTGLSLPGIVRKLRAMERKMAAMETELFWHGIKLPKEPVT